MLVFTITMTPPMSEGIFIPGPPKAPLMEPLWSMVLIYGYLTPPSLKESLFQDPKKAP